MPSRLLARAREASSAAAERRAPDLAFEAVPEVPNSLYCRPRGRLDAPRVEALDAEIAAALGDSNNILFFDCSLIGDIEAAGIGLWVALQKKLRNRDGDLILCGIRPKQQRFLETLGFSGFFSLALDLESAIEYILGVKRDIFPLSAPCPACSSPLGIERPGRSRCRACKAVLTVMRDGRLELG